jgi:tetratricopeptide (TPR) repeat protein
MNRFLPTLLVCLIALAPAPQGAGASSKHWRAAVKQAEDAWKKRDFPKARSILESEAAEAAELGSEVAAQNSYMLATVITDLREFDDADQVLTSALDKLGPNPVGQVQQVWRGLLLAGRAHNANLAGRRDDALNFAEQGRNVLENVAGSNEPELFRLYQLIGSIHMRNRNYPEAEKAYLRALKQAEIRQTFIGSQWTGPNEDVNVYVMRNSVEGRLRVSTDLGDVNLAQGKLKEAETYYLKALKIAEQDYGKKHQAAVLPLEGLATVHLKTNRRKEFESDVQRVYELSTKAPGLQLWVLNPLWLKLSTDLNEGANPLPTAEKIAQVCLVQNFDTKVMASRSMEMASNDVARVEQLQNTFRTAALNIYSAAPLRVAPMLIAYAQHAEAAQKPALARTNYEILAKTQENAPEKALYLACLGKIADALIAENKRADALPLLQKISVTLASQYGDDSRVANAIDREADLLKELGRDAEAKTRQAAAAEIRKKAFSK